MPVTLITPTAYARHRGCDEKAVRKAIAAGRISTIDGKIDPAVADIQWAQNTRARADSRRGGAEAPPPGAAASSSPAEPPQGPGSTGGYNDHRTRREAAEAERAELEVQRLAGKLVDRDRVESAVFDLYRKLRDRALAVPRRCAPTVIGLTEVREVELAMEDELRKAFEAFEQDARSMDARVSA